MNYIDANVFIYAGTDGGAKGKQAAKALGAALAEGAVTASLTCDEVLWAIGKKLGRDVARDKVRQLLALDLDVQAVNAADIKASLQWHEDGLAPRDAIHVAVAKRIGCTTIVSSDSDFDTVPGLHRLDY